MVALRHWPRTDVDHLLPLTHDAVDARRGVIARDQEKNRQYDD